MTIVCVNAVCPPRGKNVERPVMEHSEIAKGYSITKKGFNSPTRWLGGKDTQKVLPVIDKKQR